MRLPLNIFKRQLHNSLTNSTAIADKKTEYSHFYASATNCLIICGTLFCIEQYKNIKPIQDSKYRDIIYYLKKN